MRLIVILALGICLRLVHMFDVRQRTPDERIYTAMAAQVAADGHRAFPRLFQQYNATPQLWIFPPPTRVGYIATLALWMRLAQYSGVEAGAWLSFACSVGSMGLLWWMVKGGDASEPARPNGVALTSGLVTLFVQATNPFEILIARRCWSDSLVGLIGLALLWLTLEIRRDPSRLWPFAAFATVGAYGIAVKELLAVVFDVLILCNLWWFLRCPSASRATAAGAFPAARPERWIIPGVILAVAAWLMCLSAGCATNFLAALRNMSSAVAANDYAWDYQNLDWWRWLAAVGGMWPMAVLAVWK